MKNLILVAALFVSGLVASAQTSNSAASTTPPASATSGGTFSIDALLQNGISNGGVYVVAGRSLKGDNNVVGFGYIYNMATSTNGASAGLVAGYDQLSSKGVKQANILKGGLNLSATIHPLTSLGFTNFVVQPYVSVLIATPTGGTSNNGGIGQITDTGIGIPLYKFKSVTAYLTLSYENRTGEGSFNGNYALLGLTVK